MLPLILATTSSKSSIMIITTLQIVSLSLLGQTVNSKEISKVSEEDIGDIINLNVLEDERLPVPNALIGQYPHDFDLLTPGFSRRSHAGQGSSGHSYSEQGRQCFKLGNLSFAL